MFTSIATHLLESTVFAAACALAAFTLRRHRAAVRHGLWLAATAKFLVPFALLAAIGSQVSWRPMIPAPLRVEARVTENAARQPLLRINAPDGPPETAPIIGSASPIILLPHWFLHHAADIKGLYNPINL